MNISGIKTVRNTLIGASVLAGAAVISSCDKPKPHIEQKFEYPTAEFYDSLSANLGKNDRIDYYDGRIIGERFRLNDSVDVERSYNNKTGEIEYEIFRNNRHIDLPYTKKINYSSEYRYLESNFADKTKTNLLATELDEDLKSGFSLLKVVSPRLKHNVINRVNNSNVFNVLDDYEKLTERNLIDDLKSIKNPFYINDRNCLIDHIYQSIRNFDDNKLPEIGKYISKKVQKALENGDNKRIIENLDLLNDNTITYFFEENNKKYSIHKGFLEKIEEKSGTDFALSVAHKLSDIALGSGLDKDGLFLFTEDIKKDIKSHPNDLRKLDVDFMRLGNRKIIDTKKDRFNLYKMPYIPPNGKLDYPFSQGYIGECSIISEISAFLEKPKGKMFLESLLSYNKKNGNITVNLAGVNKKYTFSTKYLKTLKSFTNGDGDIRAIEAAVDVYLKENAYANRKAKSYDITIGNDANTLFEILAGNSTYYWYPSFDDFSIDFSNPNRAYSIAININDNDYTGGIKIYSDKKEYRTLRETHAYAVVMSDKDAIYLIDPNDKNNTGTRDEYIKILKQDIKGINCTIASVLIPDIKLRKRNI